MNILLFGSKGQLGWELHRSLSVLGNVVPLTKARREAFDGDLANLDGIRSCIRAVRPDVIVNAAAYTDVQSAELNPEYVLRVNSEAPQVMAEEAARSRALLVHYSTDYVFDGAASGAYSEDSEARPLNMYGRSKLAGDDAIASSGCHSLVFRTSWVFSALGKNFLTTMVKLLSSQDRLNVVSDQVGAPTSAELIADVTAHALLQTWQNRERCGLYNLTASGETSWWQFAGFIADHLRARGVPGVVEAGDIKPVSSAEYATGVVRPLNSRLNCRRLQETFGVSLPDWTVGASRILEEKLVDPLREKS